VTGDGYPDIAVGVPGEDIGSIREAGSVVLLKGGASGLTGTGAQAFNQSTSGVPGASEKGDNFGASVLLADVNANNRADLAVGTPQEDGTYQDSGAAWLLRGSKTGLTTTNIASFSPSTLHAPEKGSHAADAPTVVAGWRRLRSVPPRRRTREFPDRWRTPSHLATLEPSQPYSRAGMGNAGDPAPTRARLHGPTTWMRVRTTWIRSTTM
jgi:hypothetical protein